MFELLNSIMKKIGEEHVIQVTTNGVSNYVDISRMLKKTRKLF